MRPITPAALCLLLALGCGGSDAPPAAESPAPVAAAALYDEALSEQPCALLTAEMVAPVAAVPVEQLDQREVSGMCIYSWDGGSASIAFIRTYESPEKARARFENAHQSLSGAEVQAAMAEIADRAREMLEEEAAAGEDAPDPEHVEPVAGTMAASMGGGITFEAVGGLGELAAFETTRHETQIGGQAFVSYANKLDVLAGNLTFDVSFAHDGEARMYREEAIALARAVLDGLAD